MKNLELKGQTLKEIFIEYAKLCIDGEYHFTKEHENILSVFKNGKYGLMIHGNPGTGKTFIFEILHRIINPRAKIHFRKINVLKVVLDFNSNGHRCLRNYMGDNILFDDLGTEKIGSSYGDKIEVFQLLIQLRYDLWRSEKKRTFFTTNKTEDEINERYGERCSSRIYEMCDRFIIDGEDKRMLRNFKKFIPVLHDTKTDEDREWEKYYDTYKKAIKNNIIQYKQQPTKGQLMRQRIGNIIPEIQIRNEINKIKKERKNSKI